MNVVIGVDNLSPTGGKDCSKSIAQAGTGRTVVIPCYITKNKTKRSLAKQVKNI